MKHIIIGTVLLSVATASVAAPELESLENISQELVKIRQQIETLHSQINFEQEQYRDQIRSYANQKSDLDVRISRADLNIQDLERELKKLSETNDEKNRAQADITPVLKQSIRALRSSVAKSLPFKRDQRLEALGEIESRLDAGVISPNKAANQLWAYVEDELVLGKSSGIYNDTITVDGQDTLVKVLRIGKVAMFFKPSDGSYGVTRLENGQWTQAVLEDSDSIAQLDTLFDAFAKNIRNGEFVTPNFLPRS